MQNLVLYDDIELIAGCIVPFSPKCLVSLIQLIESLNNHEALKFVIYSYKICSGSHCCFSELH